MEELHTLVKPKRNERIKITKPKYQFITSHIGRRTFIILALKKGIPHLKIMDITGHKDYKTFRKYVMISGADKAEVMNEIFPNTTISTSTPD